MGEASAYLGYMDRKPRDEEREQAMEGPTTRHNESIHQLDVEKVNKKPIVQ